MNRLHNVSLKFDLHEATGRTMVKVIDRETEEVIREFPPEKVLDLAAKMEEMLGILFDQKI
jgi:flagellar protein FlaG